MKKLDMSFTLYSPKSDKTFFSVMDRDDKHRSIKDIVQLVENAYDLGVEMEGQMTIADLEEKVQTARAS